MLLFIVPAWWNWWCIVRGEYIRTCTFGLRAKVARTDHMVIILVSFRRSVGCVCAGVEYIYAHTHMVGARKGEYIQYAHHWLMDTVCVRAQINPHAHTTHPCYYL